MRIWPVSDLHVNHAPWSPSYVPNADVMVVAGDVSDNAGESLRQLYRFGRYIAAPIVFVPGNHDFFGGSLDQFELGRERLAADGIHVLPSGQSVVLGGVRFVGATLWTDFEVFETEFASQMWAARHMPEYRHVWKPDGSDTIWPRDTAEAHERHRAAIYAHLTREHAAGPTVVVTHHAPSRRSLDRPIDESAGAFASDLEIDIRTWQPELWIHGHIHEVKDYRIENTRVLANPRGYQGDYSSEKTGFDDDLVVTV